MSTHHVPKTELEFYRHELIFGSWETGSWGWPVRLTGEGDYYYSMKPVCPSPSSKRYCPPPQPVPWTTLSIEHGARSTAKRVHVGLISADAYGSSHSPPHPRASTSVAPFTKEPWDFHELFILNNLEQASGPQWDAGTSNFCELLIRATPTR